MLDFLKDKISQALPSWMGGTGAASSAPAPAGVSDAPVADTAPEEGGGIFSAITKPFRLVSAALSGALNSAWTGAMFTGGIMFMKSFAPQLWRLALNAKDKVFGTTGSAEKAALKLYDPEHKQDTGTSGMLIDSAIEGFGAGAALGAAGGVMQEAAIGGVGGMLGTVALVGGALVTIGAVLNKSDEGKLAAGSAPLPTPGSPNKGEKAKA